MALRTCARWLLMCLLLCYAAACAAPLAVSPTSSASTPLPTAALATQAPPATGTRTTVPPPSASPTSAIGPLAASPTSAPVQPASALELATATPGLPFPTHTIGGDTVDQIELIGTLGYGGARAGAIAPDGHVLAVGTTAGLALFELPGFRPLRFQLLDGGVGAVAFSPDGAVVAVSRQQAEGEATELRRVVDGQLLGRLLGGVPRFLLDGQMIATLADSSTRQPTTRLWRVADRQLAAEIAGVIVDTSSDSRFLATRDSQYLDPLPALQVRAADGARLFERPGRFAAFSPDGQLCAIADDTSVQLVRLPDGQLLGTLAIGAAKQVWAVAFSADGRQLFVQADADLQVWSVPEAKLIRNLPELTKDGQVSGGEFTPNRDVLVVRSSLGDGAVATFVRTADGSTIHEEEPYVVDVTYGGSGRLAALVTPDMFANGHVRVLDLSGGANQDIDIIGFQNVAFSPDAQTLAASTGAEVQLYRVTDGGLLRALRVENGPIAAQNSVLAFAPDGEVLSLSGELNVPYGGPLFGVAGWRLADGSSVAWRPPSTPAQISLQVATTAGGYAAAQGATVTFEAQDTAPITRTLDRDIVALSFSLSGALLAIGDTGGMVHVLSAAGGAPRGAYRASGPPQLIAFSPDASLLGALGGDGGVDVWQIGQPEVFAHLAAKPGDTRLIFSADNKLAISGGPSGVNIFSLPTGALLRALPIGIDDLALGPRRRVLALLHDHAIQLWGVE